MSTSSDAIIKRFQEKLTALNLKLSERGDNERFSILLEIISSLFDFSNEDIEAVSDDGKSNKFVKVFQGEEICFLVLNSLRLSPGMAAESYKLQARFVAATDGDKWDVYATDLKSPRKYQVIGSFKLSELDPSSPDSIRPCIILCRESHSKECFTDGANRNRWYCYGSNKDAPDYTFLVNFWLYEDGSEKVNVPLLDLTLWGNSPFEARRYALKAIDKYLKEKFGKTFPPEEKFETIAFRKETTNFRQKSKAESRQLDLV